MALFYQRKEPPYIRVKTWTEVTKSYFTKNYPNFITQDQKLISKENYLL